MRRKMSVVISGRGKQHPPYRDICLRVEYVFTYSCDAATRIWITYSAWWTLYMSGTRIYSRLMYSQYRLNLNRISNFLLRSAYSICRDIGVASTPHNLAFTRYSYYQYWMMYGIQKGGGWGRILPNSSAIVLQQCGQCRRARRMKWWLIRAQTSRSKTISCKGQLTIHKHTKFNMSVRSRVSPLRGPSPLVSPESTHTNEVQHVRVPPRGSPASPYI